MSDAMPLVAIEDVSTTTVSYVDKKTKDGERDVLLCNYTDVYYNRFIHSGIEFMSATATEREISRSSLQRGDVIITKDSEEQDDIGVPALVEDDIPGLVCGYHLAIIRPHEDVLNSRYLLYTLTTDPVKEQFHRIARGLTRFGLRKEEMKAVQIPLPPLAEQRRIVTALEAQLAAAERARRAALSQLNALEAMPAALLRKVFEREAKIKSWPRVEIFEICRVFTGGPAPQGDQYFGTSGPLFFRVRDLSVHNRTTDLSTARDRLSPIALDTLKLIPVKPNTLIFPKSGAAIATNNRALTAVPGYLVSHLMGLEAGESVLPRWLYYAFCTLDMTDFSDNTGYPSLRKTTVEKIEIPLPPLAEQRSIVAELERELAAVERARAAAREGLALAEALPGAILRRAFAPGAST